jgi:hypothetical protein
MDEHAGLRIGFELVAEGFELVGEPFELLAQAADFFFELADPAAAGAAASPVSKACWLAAASPLIRWV